VSRIAIVKADKARAVEDLLIRMAQGGQVRSKITEKQLIELLEQVNQQTKHETKIVVREKHFCSRLAAIGRFHELSSLKNVVLFFLFLVQPSPI